jgi:ATP-dependent DNA ligase
MAKSLSTHSTYEPDVRTNQWAKLKKDALNNGMGVADSIDVLIIGAWWGNGRKAGWMSPFLAAVYNPETEGQQTHVTRTHTLHVARFFTHLCSPVYVVSHAIAQNTNRFASS